MDEPKKASWFLLCCISVFSDTIIIRIIIIIRLELY